MWLVHIEILLLRLFTETGDLVTIWRKFRDPCNLDKVYF